jgi:hypothetical protein
MHLFVSIIQCMARLLCGVNFAAERPPYVRRPAEAFSLRSRCGDHHWPGVGWMKVRLMLEEFGGMPCRRMVPCRAPLSQQVNLRAQSIHSESFIAEFSPPSYLRNCFSPPDYRGK